MRSRRNKRVAGGSDAVVQNRSRKRRKMIGKDKEWCLFCFNVGERSLYSVPKSWVSSFKNLKKPLGGGRYKLFYKCWWPKEDSSEATASKMKMLVRNCSEPDFDQWTQRRGKPLGTFLELEKCEAALAKREGLSTSESENNGEESAEISPPGRAQARSQDDVADQDNETAGLSSAKRPAPQLTAHRRLASVFAADAQLSKIPRVELTPTEGRGSIMQMLGILMEKQNDLIRSVSQLNDKVDALHAHTFPQSVNSRTYQEKELDDENTAEMIIRRMASSNPEVRATTNYKQCLEVMGLPVKSLEELKSANNTLDGEDNETRRRRNALINALTAYTPGMGQGKNTITRIVRDCLYAIAPVYLWQCFSSQGKSGTAKGSLARELPQIYRVVMAVVITITSMDSNTIISTIAAVIRSCPTRAESRKYRQDHPELFPDQKKFENETTEDKTITNPAIAISSMYGRPLSSDEDSKEDIPASSPECSTRQQPLIPVMTLQKTCAVPSAPGVSSSESESEEVLEGDYLDDCVDDSQSE